MNERENIIRDFRCLKLILNLDFLNNLLSLISLFGCTFLVALSWNESNYLALVLAIASIIYIYSRYYGRDLGNMHRLPLSEKLLTGSFVRKYQPLIANNFFRHLSTFERAEQSLDSWELEKVRQFKQTKCLDNPTAFIIYDIYQAHLEKSTYSILEYK